MISYVPSAPGHAGHADRARLFVPPNAESLSAKSSLTNSRRILVWAVFVLVCMSLVATLPQTLELYRTGRVSETRGQLELRWLREGTFALIMFVVAMAMVLRRRLTVGGWAIAMSLLLGAWFATVAIWSIVVKEVSLTTVLLGLRLVQYAPLVAIGYLLTLRAGAAPLATFASLLRWYVLVQALFAVYQVVGGTGVTWNRTIFGYRAFGTFNNYNAFGPTLASCALIFCIATLWNRRKRGTKSFYPWMLLSAMLAIMSGSRTAMLCACFVVVYYQFATFRVDRGLRSVILTLFPILAIGLYIAASSPILTGRRTTTAIMEQPRLVHWANRLAAFETAGDIVFGLGMGSVTMAIGRVGANASARPVARAIGRVGANASARPVGGNPHSTYLSVACNFGFAFLFLYLAGLSATLIRGPWLLSIPFVGLVTALSVPLSLFEIFPVNVLLLFLWGCVLGAAREWLPARPRTSLSGPLWAGSTVAVAGAHPGHGQPGGSRDEVWR